MTQQYGTPNQPGPYGTPNQPGPYGPHGQPGPYGPPMQQPAGYGPPTQPGYASQPPHYPPQPPQPHRKKGGGGPLKWILIIGVLFGLMVACMAAIGSGDKTTGKDKVAAADKTGRAAANDDPTDQPTKAEETTEETTAKPSQPPPAAKPKVYTGSGSRVIRIKKTTEAGLITVEHHGQSNVVVYGVTPSGEEGELLANGIGNHKGTRIYNLRDGSEIVAFKVTADGSWTITLKPLEMARRWTGAKISGVGDDVLILDPQSEGFQTIKSKYVGESNFVVYGYSDRGESLLANEIGTSTAEDTLPDGTRLVKTESEGKWTLTRTGV
ncbi:hypothetical protein [Microtetraspora malaysiensis]|uniref:Uncharacterized protein n=1 Tax=Microtetraspora malaysiensis TaxID=161358 RepID=A0ABW6T303_9ACTN